MIAYCLFRLPHEIYVPALLRSHSSIFSSVHFFSWPAFGTRFQDHTRLLETEARLLWRGFLERFPQVRSKWFHKSKQKFYFWFSSQKDEKKLWKPSALIQKVLVWFFGPSKKYSIRVTIPLSSVHYVIWPHDPAISLRSSACF